MNGSCPGASLVLSVFRTCCGLTKSRGMHVRMVSSQCSMHRAQGYFERNILQALLAVEKAPSQNFTFPAYVVPGVAASIT